MNRRFSGIIQLYGEAGFARFQSSHIAVIGIGGVGSWVAEGLARSGIGQLSLIDLDHIAVSNINRQIHALDSNLGQAKVKAMAHRIQWINPECRVHPIEAWLTPENCAEWINEQDLLIDCIDQSKNKAALLAHAYQIDRPVICIGGAGGQKDPSRIRYSDLSRTEQDPLLAKTRQILRQKYGFARQGQLGIPAIWSDEPVQKSTGCQSLHCGGFGSSVAVTASFAFLAVAKALSIIIDI